MSTEKPSLRVGVLGFAHYHANFWSEAFLADSRVRLVGIWDDDPKRLQSSAERFATQGFTDLHTLLGHVDAVAVCSETSRHLPLIEAAADRGLAVLCEKPLATTLEDAACVARLVRDRSVPFVQSFPKRLDPASLAVKASVEGGELGQVRLVRIRHGHDHASDPTFTAGWWTDPASSGGGTLIDEGVHAFDFLRWLLGNPETVQASLSHFEGLAVEDAAIAQLRWANGTLADVATSWSFAGAQDSVEIYGSEATLLLSGVDLASRDLAAPPYLRIARRGASSWDESPLVPRFKLGGFHHAVARHFVDHLLEGQPPCATAVDGQAAVAIVSAAYASASSGRTERIVYHPQPLDSGA